MLYTTLTFNGEEMSLADWGIKLPSRAVQNQANDELSFTITMPADGASVFPYAAFILIQIGRVGSAANPFNASLPNSVAFTPGLTFSGGTKWFQGFCICEKRIGQPTNEALQYKFAGPYQFFFDRTVFQKLQLSYSAAAEQMIPDWQSDVILGMSLSPLTAGSDSVPGTTATNLMSIAQQVKEICTFAKTASTYQQANPGLFPYAPGIDTWPAGAQFSSDDVSSDVTASGYDLLKVPSANVLLEDFSVYGGASLPAGNLSTAAGVPASPVFQLRAPLDAVNGATCKGCLEKMLQWLGGVGSPVVWTDHTTSPPTLHIATKQNLITAGKIVNLAISPTVRPENIRQMTELVPTCVHFKYRIVSTINGQPVTTIIHDIAAYIAGTLYEGIGELRSLTTLAGVALSGTIQGQLQALALTPGAVVQTIDLQGNQVTQQNCNISVTALNLANPTGGGSSTAFWQLLFPHLKNTAADTLAFYDATNCPVTVTDPATGAAIDPTTYVNMLNPGCQIAAWMLKSTSTPSTPIPGLTKQARITATFKYQESLPGASAVSGSTIGNKPMFKDVTLTTLGSGTYYSAPAIAYGEPVPYGLAGYFCALESLPMFEGEILIQEQDITDQCPIGNVVNLTGGLAAWQTMNATVQSIAYNFESGETRISIGPAKHLGPAQFVQRQRTNLGPRWYNILQINPLGNATQGNQLSNNVAQADTTPGATNPTMVYEFTNLEAQQASAATLPAGIHRDMGTAASPFSSTIASGQRAFYQGQALTLAQGPYSTTPGESMNWIRIALSDIGGTDGVLSDGLPLHPYFREIPDCKTISGTPTPGFRLVLCSEFYITSIRSTPDP